MNNPPQASKFAKHKKTILVTIAVVILGFSAWFILRDYFFLPFDNRNFAEEVAEPIEQSFVKLGANVKCIDAYSGRGADSRQPSYMGYLELPVDRQQAIQIIQQALEASGYNATHATMQDRGPIPVADQFVDNWYYDYGKASSYNSLQSGAIELTAHIVEDGTHSYYCGADGTELTSNATQTGVILSVKLPSFK